MEDIIGFEEQIGAKFINVVRKAVKNPIQAATMKAKANIATMQAKSNLANKMLQQRNTMVANRIAKGLPIPANIKNAIVKTAQAGKPLPNVIKQGLAMAKQKKSVVPIALPKRANLTRTQILQKAKTAQTTPAQMMQRAVAVTQQKAIAPQSTQGSMLKRAIAIAKQKAPVPVSALTRVTNPNLVNQATPIQKSFMPVDLPYKNFAPNTAPMKIPATNFTLSTSIDLVEPSVDAGSSNYYGK